MICVSTKQPNCYDTINKLEIRNKLLSIAIYVLFFYLFSIQIFRTINKKRDSIAKRLLFIDVEKQFITARNYDTN